jgi:hypothetical protein
LEWFLNTSFRDIHNEQLSSTVAGILCIFNRLTMLKSDPAVARRSPAARVVRIGPRPLWRRGDFVIGGDIDRHAIFLAGEENESMTFGHAEQAMRGQPRGLGTEGASSCAGTAEFNIARRGWAEGIEHAAERLATAMLCAHEAQPSVAMKCERASGGFALAAPRRAKADEGRAD